MSAIDIIKLVGLGLLATVSALVLKGVKSEMALIVTLVASIVIMSLVVLRLGVVVQFLADLGARSGIEWTYLKLILKAVGVAYVANFGAQVCRDAGEGTIAVKLEMAGKVSIMVLALPVITAVVDAVTRLLESGWGG